MKKGSVVFVALAVAAALGWFQGCAGSGSSVGGSSGASHSGTQNGGPLGNRICLASCHKEGATHHACETHRGDPSCDHGAGGQGFPSAETRSTLSPPATNCD